ncbi:VOC family protein [Ascidiimonas sp. W6]|uniref:VOC family protein n=1 Tax=Ascidiimonas meishanensis TaxID=3128903 RepID=UPI0030EEA2C3
MSQQNNHINYIEFKAKDLDAIKTFYTKVFGWVFTDYGPTYASFEEKESGVAGGFETTEEEILNGALVVLYHEDLHKIKSDIITAGGSICIDIFSFPGGKRFQFKDPSGNELAIWSDK